MQWNFKAFAFIYCSSQAATELQTRATKSDRVRAWNRNHIVTTTSQFPRETSVWTWRWVALPRPVSEYTPTLWGLSTKRPLQFKVITWITSDISMKASWCSAVSKANYLQTLKRSHCCGYKWVQLWIWTPNHNGLIKMEKVPPIIILSRATGMIKVLPKWNLMHNQ